jgi:hypothetical protein
MMVKKHKKMKKHIWLSGNVLLWSLLVFVGSGRMYATGLTKTILFYSGISALQDDTTILKSGSNKEAQKMERKQRHEAQRDLARANAKERNKPVPNPNHADYILLGKNLPSGRPLLETIAGRVPGMMIEGTNVMTRGPSSFQQRPEPLFIIDGMPAGLELANSIPVEQIERIEIFIGPSAAMYGTRASNGVIAIYRKLTAK